MKGQLRFDEFMNIIEEQPVPNVVECRPLMADPCYYCLCNSCINNAESLTIHPDELPYDWNPCFLCDECIKFDGKELKNMCRTKCIKFEIDNYHADLNRKKFRVIS